MLENINVDGNAAWAHVGEEMAKRERASRSGHTAPFIRASATRSTHIWNGCIGSLLWWDGVNHLVVDEPDPRITKWVAVS
jgi:hypothetical protein